jgi:hypothetical protein
MEHNLRREGKELLSERRQVQDIHLTPVARLGWVLRRRDIDVDDRVAMAPQCLDGIGPYEPRAPRDEDPQRSLVKRSQLWITLPLSFWHCSPQSVLPPP